MSMMTMMIALKDPLTRRRRRRKRQKRRPLQALLTKMNPQLPLRTGYIINIYRSTIISSSIVVLYMFIADIARHRVTQRNQPRARKTRERKEKRIRGSQKRRSQHRKQKKRRRKKRKKLRLRRKGD